MVQIFSYAVAIAVASLTQCLMAQIQVDPVPVYGTAYGTEYGTETEIIIGTEPISGTILGVVQADGSIVALPNVEVESVAETPFQQNAASETGHRMVEQLGVATPAGATTAFPTATQTLDDEAERKLKTATSQLAEQKAQEAELLTQLSKVRKKLVEANREMVKLRADIDESDATINRLKKRNDLRVKSNAKLKSKLTELQDFNKSLELSVASLKEQLEIATADKKTAREALEELNREAEKQKKAHEAQIAKLDAQHSDNAKSHRDAMKQLKDTQDALALEKNKYNELKSKFIEAFEAERTQQEKSDREPNEKQQRKRWQADRDDAKRAAKNGDIDNEPDKETDTPNPQQEKKTPNAKDEKRQRRETKLLAEMNEKMSAAEKRIRTAGSKKIELLLENGEKESSPKIKAAKEDIEDSVKISNRKIRARYIRRIKRLK